MERINPDPYIMDSHYSEETCMCECLECGYQQAATVYREYGREEISECWECGGELTPLWSMDDDDLMSPDEEDVLGR